MLLLLLLLLPIQPWLCVYVIDYHGHCRVVYPTQLQL